MNLASNSLSKVSRYINLTACPRSYPLVRASFREIFVIFGRFSKFSDVFGPVRICSDMFGPIRMHWDALRCIKMRSDSFGNFRIFLNFWSRWDVFQAWGLTFIEIRRLGGLLLLGANYWEAALNKFPKQVFVKTFATNVSKLVRKTFRDHVF